MSLIAKYARATQSSNLKDDELHHNTEPLAAVALSAGVGVTGIGNLLFRVKYANDATSYNQLLEKWDAIVSSKSVERKWPSHIVAKTVAKVSLDHFINDVCPACSGKGHLPIFSSPVLSDDPCPSCKGQGVKALDCGSRLADYVQDMVESLSELTRYAAGEAMRKLSSQMDL